MSDEVLVYGVLLPFFTCLGVILYKVIFYILNNFTNIGVEDRYKKRK